MVRLRAPVLETHMFNNNAYLHNEENYKMEVFSLNNVHAVDFFFLSFSFHLKNIVSDIACEYEIHQGGILERSEICLRQKKRNLATQFCVL